MFHQPSCSLFSSHTLPPALLTDLIQVLDVACRSAGIRNPNPTWFLLINDLLNLLPAGCFHQIAAIEEPSRSAFPRAARTTSVSRLFSSQQSSSIDQVDHLLACHHKQRSPLPCHQSTPGHSSPSAWSRCCPGSSRDSSPRACGARCCQSPGWPHSPG